jgi:hypothetical protein
MIQAIASFVVSAENAPLSTVGSATRIFAAIRVISSALVGLRGGMALVAWDEDWKRISSFNRFHILIAVV